MKKVLVFGTFDILHRGHHVFLEQAKAQGDYLVAVVARDKTVEQLKGEKPQHDEETRRKKLEKLSFVDEVYLGSLGNKYDIIERINPDIICIGYDQKHFVRDLQQEIKNRHLKAQIIYFKEGYKPHIFKSTLLRNKSINNKV